MIETELKITLDAGGMARLSRHPALAGLRLVPRRREMLVSVYYDTAERALAAAGVALRLRRVGKRWVQTIKRRAGAAAGSGLFANRESECPAPGGRMVLDGPDPDGALAEVLAAAGGAPLAPIFETHVARLTERLRAPAGGEVELALDSGEIRAGEARAPIREAELELKAGEVGAVYAVARLLFAAGPVQFAAANKSARGYRLAATGKADAEAGPRHAATLAVDREATVEIVARDILRDCLAQISINMAVVAESTAAEGPHQLRIGLRRLRTAFDLFGPHLGEAAMTSLSATAQRLGREVGRLRDSDVLIEDVVAGETGAGVDAEAAAALAAVLMARREAVRAAVCRTLAAPEAVGFLFDLGAFIEGRGWLAPADFSQTERLATPIGAAAPEILDARRALVLKRGRKVRKLDAEGLHELRKALKKLRYAVDMLGPAYKEAKVEDYLASLKELQDSFGALNDAAMATEALAGPEAPARDDPAVQRAAGWVLGALTVRMAEDRPELFKHWKRLSRAKPFWS